VETIGTGFHYVAACGWSPGTFFRSSIIIINQDLHEKDGLLCNTWVFHTKNFQGTVLGYG